MLNLSTIRFLFLFLKIMKFTPGGCRTKWTLVGAVEIVRRVARLHRSGHDGRHHEGGLRRLTDLDDGVVDASELIEILSRFVREKLNRLSFDIISEVERAGKLQHSIIHFTINL